MLRVDTLCYAGDYDAAISLARRLVAQFQALADTQREVGFWRTWATSISGATGTPKPPSASGARWSCCQARQTI